MTAGQADRAAAGPVVDSHLHIWDRSRAPYNWLDSAPAVLDRAFAWDEVAPSMRRHGVDAAVLIQADDDPGDTALMLENARAEPTVIGVVASLPLDDTAASVALLERYAFDELIVGIRSLSHDHPDPDWLLGDAQGRSLEAIAESGLTFELVPATLRHLEVTTILRDRHPDLRLAIDHLGTPPIGADLAPWSAAIGAVAGDPHLHAKLSGLYARRGSPDSWTTDDLRRVVDRAVEVFGADRLMFGSDWPVAEIAGGYDRVVPALLDVIGGHGSTAADRMRGGTAVEFYGLDLPD